jgi:F-type H+-transporting ATPase subunit gamma
MQAMKMIATVKYAKTQIMLTSFRPYFDAYKKIVTVVSNSSGDLDNKFLKEDKKAGKSLLVLISSDRGLCGSYNAGLFRLIEKQDFLQKDVIKLFVGKKGQDYFKEDSFGEEIFSVDEKNYKAVSENVTNKFLKPFLDGQFDEVYIAYNKFVSAITQVLEYTKDGSEAVGYDILIEPDPNLFIETVFPKFLNLTVSSLLLESVTSEHAARTAAMDSATRNADEIIKETTMLFNKTRQAYITTELMDIVNGAEAIK